MIHSLAATSFGTVYVTVPLRTFLSTITIPGCTTNFDIFTGGAAIFPASGTHGVAAQPNSRLDEAGCNKQPGYREYFHVDVVNLPLELA